MAVQLGAMRRSGWDQQGVRRGTARRAFTLVELLVVIGIIAVLVSILLPTLAAARGKAQIVQCQSNVRQLVIAAMMFANDHKGYIPTSSDNVWAQDNDPEHYKFAWRNNISITGTLGTTGGPVVVYDWASSLIPYLGGQVGDSFVTSPQSQSKAFRCPADPWLDQQIPPANYSGSAQEGPGYSLLNNVAQNYYYGISYGINGDIASLINPSSGVGEDGPSDSIGVVGGPNTPSNSYGGGANNTVGQPMQCKLNRVYEPQSTMLFADCGTRPHNLNGQANNRLNYNDELLYTSNYNATQYNTKTTLGDEGTLLGELSCAWLQLRIPTNRHNGVICVGYCDGHAEAVPLAFYHRVRISPYNWQR
jgi:prepilin-type N-terminal cleavage/methylation domain-containing protein